MTDMAAEQQQINDLGTAITAVAGHVSSASATLGQWITEHQSAPLDFTPALNALSSLQAADGTLQGVVPQAPAAPLDTPVPDPGPPPAADTPVDPATAPDLPAGGDVTVATDPTTSADAGAATDTGTAAADTGSPDAPPSF